MAQQTLIPAFLNFTLDSKDIDVLDTQLSLKFENGTGYEECMTKTGQKGYVLKKGNTVLQSGDIHITVVKTPDGKHNDDIKALQDNLANVQKNSDPKAYVKNINVQLLNPGNTKFMGLSFSGYVSEVETKSPDSTNFAEYLAKIEVYDPMTIALTK
jgi:hypothetical protein